MLNIISFLAETVRDEIFFCNEAGEIFYLIGTVINLFKIIIPIIIVLLAILDLGKASMAGEEKEIKEAQKMLIKRLIYGVLIFFVTTIVQLLVTALVGDTTTTTSNCWKCAVHDEHCDRTNTNTDTSGN